MSSTSPRPTSFGTILRSSSHVLRVGVLHRLGQHVVQLDNLDVAVTHLVHEVEVVAPGVLHPQHIVEQQVVTIGRGETLVRQAR